MECGMKENTLGPTYGSASQKQFKVQLMLLNEINVLGYNQ